VLFDENDKQTIYPAPMAGLATGIFTDGGIVVGGDKGLAAMIGDRFRQLTAADPEVLQNISGLVVTPDGDRWLNGGKGLVHIRGEDWKAALLHRSSPCATGYSAPTAMSARRCWKIAIQAQSWTKTASFG
jgi:hypothetical protein